MDDRNAQVGWTEAQWNRVREEVLEAWQRVRVAGSFLPIYGPLPPSTQVVPSEVLKSDGSVDDRATAALIEIDLPVTLSRQQIWEEDLSSALLQFRRRATQLAQFEDWFIFNGTYPSSEPLPDATARDAFDQEQKAGHPGYRPELAHLEPSQGARISGTPTPIEGVGQNLQLEGMSRRNPGALGLIEAPRVVLMKKAAQARQEAEQATEEAKRAPGDQQAAQRAAQAEQRAAQAEQQASTKNQLNNTGLIQAIVNAINSLEDNGYVPPYVCVFGRNPFQAAFTPIDNSTVLPRDRIEPLIGRELLHASGIDILPHRSIPYNLDGETWRSRGVLLSMSNEPIDLALAVEATPEFRQVDSEGRYVFSVFERFALRIKDAKAIAPLMFETPAEAKERVEKERAEKERAEKERAEEKPAAADKPNL